MNPYETLSVALEGAVAHVAFARPERANAFNAVMWRELGAVMQWADTTPAVRSVVLSGQGKHFTAGIDLAFLQSLQTELVSMGPGRREERLLQVILDLQATVSAIEHCRKPVIAAIHGACVGGGIDISCACDLRFAAGNTRFAVKEIDIAIVADLGTLQRLPRLVGEGLARELALTGRDFGAEEAARIGFLNAVLPEADSTLAHALQVAHTIAAKSPLAMRGTKETLNFSRDHSVAEGLAFVAARNAALLAAPDVPEAIRAQAEGRAPRFED